MAAGILSFLGSSRNKKSKRQSGARHMPLAEHGQLSRSMPVSYTTGALSRQTGRAYFPSRDSYNMLVHPTPDGQAARKHPAPATTAPAATAATASRAEYYAHISDAYCIDKVGPRTSDEYRFKPAPSYREQKERAAAAAAAKKLKKQHKDAAKAAASAAAPAAALHASAPAASAYSFPNNSNAPGVGTVKRGLLRHTLSRISLATAFTGSSSSNTAAPSLLPRKYSAPAVLSKSSSSYNLRNLFTSEESAPKEPHYRLRRLQFEDEVCNGPPPAPVARAASPEQRRLLTPSKSLNNLRSYSEDHTMMSTPSKKYQPQDQRYNELVSFVSYIERSAHSTPESSPSKSIPAASVQTGPRSTLWALPSKPLPPLNAESPPIPPRCETQHDFHNLGASCPASLWPDFGRTSFLDVSDAGDSPKNQRNIKSFKYSSKRPNISHPVLVNTLESEHPRSRQATIQEAGDVFGLYFGAHIASTEAAAAEPFQPRQAVRHLPTRRAQKERSHAYAKLVSKTAAREDLPTHLEHLGLSSPSSAFDSDTASEDGTDGGRDIDLSAVLNLFPSPSASREVSPSSTILTFGGNASESEAETLVNTPSSQLDIEEFDEEQTPEVDNARGRKRWQNSRLWIDVDAANENRDWEMSSEDGENSEPAADKETGDETVYYECGEEEESYSGYATAATGGEEEEDAPTPTPATALAYEAIRKQRQSTASRYDSSSLGVISSRASISRSSYSVTHSVLKYYARFPHRNSFYGAIISPRSVSGASNESDAEEEARKRAHPFYLEEDEYHHNNRESVAMAV